MWDLTDPLRPDSIFSFMAADYAQLSCPLPSAGIDNVPSALARLCDLDMSSTAENNPYFTVVHTLVQLQNLSSDQITTVRFLSFVYHMQGPFKDLLQGKDPVALLLLALWYVMAPRGAWWIECRATVERQSICSYLQRYHRSKRAIQALLPW